MLSHVSSIVLTKNVEEKNLVIALFKNAAYKLFSRLVAGLFDEGQDGRPMSNTVQKKIRSHSQEEFATNGVIFFFFFVTD